MQDEAMRSMRKGLEAAPGDYALRRQLAETLTAAEMYQEADPHLRWCMAQHPDDGVVRQLLSDSRKAWFEQRTATRQEPLFR
jgi:predicted Zn-dependent protease